MTPRVLVVFPIVCSLGLAVLTSFGLAAPSAEPDPADGRQPAPRLATLHDPHLSLKRALAQLSSQTGQPVEDLVGDMDPVLDLDLQQVPFWQALDAVADKAGARVDLHPPGGVVALVKRPADWQPPRISHSGLFRVALTSLSAKLDLETGARACTASVEVAWEPRLAPILLETRPRALVVRDDADRLVPSGPVTSALAPVDGRTSLPFTIALPPLPRSVQKLALLEGQLYAVAPTKMLSFDFGPLDQLAKAPRGDERLQATREGVECRLNRIVAEDDRWSVEVVLDYPEGNVKLDSYQSWVVNNEMVLERRDGQRFPSSSYLLQESTPRHALLTYHFSDAEKMKGGFADWKLVYRTPALVVQAPFAFSFKDVPLP